MAWIHFAGLNLSSSFIAAILIKQTLAGRKMIKSADWPVGPDMGTTSGEWITTSLRSINDSATKVAR
jgi:hypothetical protein